MPYAPARVTVLPDTDDGSRRHFGSRYRQGDGPRWTSDSQNCRNVTGVGLPVPAPLSVSVDGVPVSRALALPEMRAEAPATFADAFEAVRKSLHLTQRRVAELHGVSPRTVERW